MGNMDYYLLSAKISGVKNIQKRIYLEFYKKTIDKQFDPDKYRVKGIFGENGFGKTAIITAFSIYRSLILSSDYLSDTSTQNFLSETVNKLTQQFSIECEFAHIGSTRIDVYKHSIVLKRDGNTYKIIEESLSHRNGSNPKSEYALIYSVNQGKIEYVNEDSDVEKWTRNTLNLLSKSSMASLILNDESLLDKGTVANSISDLLVFAVRLFVSLRNEDQHLFYFWSNNLISPDNYTKDIFDAYAEINENRVFKPRYPYYEQRIHGMERFLRLFKPDLKEIEIVKKEDGDFYYCQLNLNYGDYVINREFESEGIKKLMSVYDALRIASNGGIVFIDEFDSNINSIYLSALVEYMMLLGKGQLCFTSHNIDIMQVLKNNKYSIDFLNSNQEIIRWITNGNKSPITTYKSGLIEGMPYNIFPTDFVGVFGDE